MRREDDQELWDLLGKAAPASVSPFFARNVVREIRQQSGWRASIATWLRPRRLVPASALALAMLMAVFTLHRSPTDNDEPPGLVASIDPQDYEVVADLDDLLASEDDSLWPESSSL